MFSLLLVCYRIVACHRQNREIDDQVVRAWSGFKCRSINTHNLFERGGDKHGGLPRGRGSSIASHSLQQSITKSRLVTKAYTWFIWFNFKMRSLFANVLLLSWIGVVTASLKIPFLSRKKEYTPLVFFTLPKDILQECDEMEKVVSQVERELGVRVERLDILRDPAAEATMSALTSRRPPFLYNKESCQVISIPGADGSKAVAAAAIDKDRVRAWAKGRFLAPKSRTSRAPKILSQKDNSIDQKDLLEDMSLSPMQKKGKEAIKKRTSEKSEKSEKLDETAVSS